MDITPFDHPEHYAFLRDAYEVLWAILHHEPAPSWVTALRLRLAPLMAQGQGMTADGPEAKYVISTLSYADQRAWFDPSMSTTWSFEDYSQTLRLFAFVATQEAPANMIRSVVPWQWFVDLASQVPVAERSDVLLNTASFYHRHPIYFDVSMGNVEEHQYFQWCPLVDEVIEKSEDPSAALLAERMHLWLMQYGKRELSPPRWSEWKAPMETIWKASFFPLVQKISVWRANDYEQTGSWLWRAAPYLPAHSKYAVAAKLVEKAIDVPPVLRKPELRLEQEEVYRISSRMHAWYAPQGDGLVNVGRLGELCPIACSVYLFKSGKPDCSDVLTEAQKAALHLMDDPASFWTFVDEGPTRAKDLGIVPPQDGAFVDISV